jgi:hypothetical protein
MSQGDVPSIFTRQTNAGFDTELVATHLASGKLGIGKSASCSSSIRYI